MKFEQVVFQSAMDNRETRGHVLNVDAIQSLFNAFKKDTLSIGDIVVDVEFSAKGGNFVFRKPKELRSPEWKEYGNYMSMVCEESTCLIEHPEYRSKQVEPFNRQPPFYIGHNFGRLTKEEVDGWNVYYHFSHNSNISFGSRNFNHNTFYDTLDFSVIVNEEVLSEFISEVLNAFNIPSNVTQSVTNIVGF